MRLPLFRLLAVLLLAAMMGPAPVSGAGNVCRRPARCRGAGGPGQGARARDGLPAGAMRCCKPSGSGERRRARGAQGAQWPLAAGFDLTPPGWGIADAPVAVWQDAVELLQVFFVDASGTAVLLASDHDKWAAPMKIGPAGYFAPGAQLAAVWQPADKQTMLFGLDGNGQLKMLRRSSVSALFTTAWAPSDKLSGYNFGAPGGSVAAVYQPYGQRVMAFAVNKDGRINYVTQQTATTFLAPKYLLSRGAVAPDTQLTAARYPLGEQIEVFWVDQKGAAHVLWSAQNGNWNTQTTGGGFGTPGSALTAVYQPLHEHLEVAAITPGGGVNLLWKQDNGAWKLCSSSSPTAPCQRRPCRARCSSPRATSSKSSFRRGRAALGHMEEQRRAWYAPFKLTDIGGETLLKPGECTVFFHRWSVHPIGFDPM